MYAGLILKLNLGHDSNATAAAQARLCTNLIFPPNNGMEGRREEGTLSGPAL